MGLPEFQINDSYAKHGTDLLPTVFYSAVWGGAMKTRIMAAFALLACASQVNAQSEKLERFEYFAPLPKRGDLPAQSLSFKSSEADASVASSGIATAVVTVPLPKRNPLKRQR
jgi:hypothetical protein